MTGPTVLRGDNLGKRFFLYERPFHRVRDWLRPGRPRSAAEHWAVRGASVEVRPGEAVGVVGLNGAGKSTLLRLLAGILEPTEGRREVGGRVMPLFALGAGFRPELTGRQNVVLAADLLGLPGEYARDQIDDIARFADIGEFFDRRVSFYSRGMRTRLAFATLAFVEADCMIIDEGIAGGDPFFAEKCYERLERVIAAGTSVLMATHSHQAIARYCPRTLLLEGGRIVYDGPSAPALERFRASRRSVRVGASRPALDAAED